MIMSLIFFKSCLQLQEIRWTAQSMNWFAVLSMSQTKYDDFSGFLTVLEIIRKLQDTECTVMNSLRLWKTWNTFSACKWGHSCLSIQNTQGSENIFCSGKAEQLALANLYTSWNLKWPKSAFTMLYPGDYITATDSGLRAEESSSRQAARAVVRSLKSAHPRRWNETAKDLDFMLFSHKTGEFLYELGAVDLVKVC